MQRQTDRDFDTMLWAWQLGPSPAGLRQTWTTQAARSKKGSNFGSYENPEFDHLLDSALAAGNTAASKALFEKVYRIIIEDAPAIWLYEPETVLGIQKRIRTTPMRPDAWWLGMADWKIPADERIARDRIPAGR
jgi:ABC-type transport system substrate-binding protein